jgi:hypothetical protein
MQTEAASTMSPAEQAVAGESLGGFLRLAHLRWNESMAAKAKEVKRDDAVAAVRVVQRTQRAAARASASTTAAPRKQPAPSNQEVDITKLTKDDIAALVRQSVEQYR